MKTDSFKFTLTITLECNMLSVTNYSVSTMSFTYDGELEPNGRWLNEIELVPELVVVGEYLGDGDDLPKL